METVNQRIEMLVKHFANGKQGEFARKIGVAQSNVSSVISGRSIAPSYEMIQKIISTFPVSSDWLINGDGEMLKNAIQVEYKEVESVSIPKKLYDFVMSELDRSRRREDEFFNKLNVGNLGKYNGALALNDVKLYFSKISEN